MANKITFTIKRAWEDSWKWLLGTGWGYVVGGLIGGVVGGVLAGIIGAIIAVVATITIIFIIHLFITPSRLSKESRHKFISNNANYFSRVFGNKRKRQCQTILENIKSMIEIENKVTDSKAKIIQALPDEINHIKREFNKQTNIPLIPDSKALKLFLSGKADKKITQTINKLDLNIMGDKPTEYHIEFFIKIKTILDKTRFGIASGLPSNYVEYSRRVDELIQNEDDLLDWMLYLLTIPSGINTIYLWYCAQGDKRQQFFFQHIKQFQNMRDALKDFAPHRQTTINQLTNYASESINNM